MDYSRLVAGPCPLCGRRGCLREISQYRRTVIELFPFRRDSVLVARFYCRRKRKTASALPLQLAPYHVYTVDSMVRAVLLFLTVLGRKGKREEVLAEFDAESPVAVCHVRGWLGVLVRDLRRSHGVLLRGYGLTGIRSGRGFQGMTSEAGAYLTALGVRGPPEGAETLFEVQRNYARWSGRFLVGIPSQDRAAA